MLDISVKKTNLIGQKETTWWAIKPFDRLHWEIDDDWLAVEKKIRIVIKLNLNLSIRPSISFFLQLAQDARATLKYGIENRKFPLSKNGRYPVLLKFCSPIPPPPGASFAPWLDPSKSVRNKQKFVRSSWKIISLNFFTWSVHHQKAHANISLIPHMERSHFCIEGRVITKFTIFVHSSIRGTFFSFWLERTDLERSKVI